jgi:hypothetical protein
MCVSANFPAAASLTPFMGSTSAHKYCRSCDLDSRQAHAEQHRARACPDVNAATKRKRADLCWHERDLPQLEQKLLKLRAHAGTEQILAAAMSEVTERVPWPTACMRCPHDSRAPPRRLFALSLTRKQNASPRRPRLQAGLNCLYFPLNPKYIPYTDATTMLPHDLMHLEPDGLARNKLAWCLYALMAKHKLFTMENSTVPYRPSIGRKVTGCRVYTSTYSQVWLEGVQRRERRLASAHRKPST